MKKIVTLFFVAMMAVISVSAAGDAKITRLDDTNYREALMNPARPLVIDFSATWCGPCKLFAPVYDEVAGEMGDKLDFYSVDVDEAPALSRMFQIQAVPTILIINPSKEKVDAIQGGIDKQAFVDRINAILE